MATRDTEGRHEIEAARQHLYAAKSHASFISKAEDTVKQMLATAKKNLEDIQLQSVSSKKKVEDAQKLLKEAEKRWEVIEIDLDDQEGNAGGSTNKKRKLSVVSPQGSDNNNEGSVTVTIPYQQGKKLGFVLIDTIGDQTRRIRLSPNSAVFKFTKQLLLEKSKGQSGVFDPLSDDVDELIDWGKDNLPPLMMNASIPFNTINKESMKLAINGIINPGIIVEKVRYRTGTLYSQDKQAIDVVKIARDPQNYPLDITFKRSSTPTSTTRNRNDNSDNGSMTNDINEIEVQGAGTPGANGTYKRDIDRRGNPSFVKRGRWQGGSEKFVIYKDYGGWNISLPSTGKDLYYKGRNTELPPKTRWDVNFHGESPGPTLQY